MNWTPEQAEAWKRQRDLEDYGTPIEGVVPSSDEWLTILAKKEWKRKQVSPTNSK